MGFVKKRLAKRNYFCLFRYQKNIYVAVKLIKSIKQVPFFRLLIFLLAAIVLAGYFRWPIGVLFALFFGFVTAFFVAFYFFRGIFKRYILSFLGYSTIFIFGVLWYSLYNRVAFSEQLIGHNQTYIGTITEQPTETAKRIKVFLKIENAFDTTAQFQPLEARVLAYLPKDSASRQLQVGHRLVVHTKLAPVQQAMNPYAFNYAQYLAQQRVFYTAFVKETEWKLIGENWHYALFRYAAQIRQYLLKIYEKQGFANQELAIVAALTLGDKSQLDPDTKQAFSVSGAMHVLAVSGLHVGIIFAMFDFMLRSLGKNKTQRFVRVFIQILILWAFATLTGLSPSVSRAATMFSFVAFGKALKRRVSIYNSLTVSAFVLLVVNPNNIYQLGFLLSYSAVIAIVAIQPLLYKWVYVKNTLLDRLWGLVTVSIAAQIGTLPISLYYFHQFPVYFLITNIIVIPLATLILYSAVALFVFSWWPWLAAIFGKITYFLVSMLNRSTVYIEQFPFSSVQNIRLSQPEMILLYFSFVTLLWFVLYKNKTMLKLALSGVIVFFVVNIYIYVANRQNSDFIVFHANNASVIAHIQAQKASIYTDSSFVTNPSVRNYSLDAYITEKSVDKLDISILNSQKNSFVQQFIFHEGKIIFVVQSEKDLLFEATAKPNIDVVVIAQNAQIEVKHIIERFNVKRIVVDTSNKMWRTKNWRLACGRLRFPCHIVAEQGAYMLSADTVFSNL